VIQNGDFDVRRGKDLVEIAAHFACRWSGTRAPGGRGTHCQRPDVRPHFTPVMGNEVTDQRRTLSMWFPVRRAARVPDHRQAKWAAIFDEIFATPDVKVAVLNHARDLHGSTRPFGPEWFNAAVGDNMRAGQCGFNADGSRQLRRDSDRPSAAVSRLDALLNHGYVVTPVAAAIRMMWLVTSSGRAALTSAVTTGMWPISISKPQSSISCQGRVLVSYGLLTELTVNGKYGSGELAALAGTEVDVQVRILGPHWTRPNKCSYTPTAS